MADNKSKIGLKKLAKNTGFLYLLSLSSQIVNLALIPFQTRVLGTEAYGVIASAVAMSAIIVVILDFGFILSATEKVVKLVGNNKELSLILGNVALAKAFLSIAVGIVLLPIVCCVELFFNNKVLFILYYFAYVVNAFLPDFFYRGHEDMRVITLRTIAIKIVSSLPVFVLLRGPEDMWVVPALLLLGNLLAVVFSYLDIRKRYGITKIRGRCVDAFFLLKASIGFFVSRFASVFYQSMNAVLLGITFPGQTVVGCYGAAEKFLSLARIMSSPVADSLYPYMVRAKNYRLCVALLVGSAPLIIIIGLFAWVFAEPLCLFCFGEGYKEAASIFRCLMPAIMVIFPTYILCFPMLVPMGLAHYANRSNVIGAIVQIALLIFLYVSNSFSVQALCVAASTSEVTVFAYRLWAVWSHKERMNLKR